MPNEKAAVIQARTQRSHGSMLAEFIELEGKYGLGFPWLLIDRSSTQSKARGRSIVRKSSTTNDSILELTLMSFIRIVITCLVKGERKRGKAERV